MACTIEYTCMHVCVGGHDGRTDVRTALSSNGYKNFWPRTKNVDVQSSDCLTEKGIRSTIDYIFNAI